MKCHLRFVMSFILTLTAGTLFSQVYDITGFGAVGDGKTLNTQALQRTINTCSEKGGGTVYIPSGTFITGTIHLKSNINIYLEAGATLKGSPDLSDYEPFNEVHYGMMYALNEENISISGTGTIDGNGDVFFDHSRPKTIGKELTKYTRQKDDYRKIKGGGVGDGPVVPLERPYQMFIFSRCNRVAIRDIFISRPPFWTLLFADCDGVTVDGIRLYSNMLAPNADGIDIASCNNVSITNCDIRTGDDAIAIVGYDHHFEIPGFSYLRHPSGNIIVSNCNLQSYSSGIRIGSLDQNTVRNIQVSNCNITNSTRGIGIFIRDEGSMENIIISNLNIETVLRTGDWWGNAEPIHISAIRGKELVKLGSLKNVRFSNIDCRSENGILVYGTEESIINNLSFENVRLEIVNSDLNEFAGGNIDLRGCLNEREQLFERDLPGLYARFVNNLDISGFELDWMDTKLPFFTHGIEIENFNTIVINDFKGNANPGNPQASRILLKDGENAKVDLTEGLKLINIK